MSTNENLSEQCPHTADGVDGVTSEALHLARWDTYLEHSPLGHFQQSSRWARMKALDGWQSRWIFAYPQQPERGGLQLLWKSIRFGRIGYVSKGPILPIEDRKTLDAVMANLKTASQALGLRALILQPPDRSSITAADLQRYDFSSTPVASIIRATALIDVSGGRESFMSRMNRKARWEARISIQRGITVRLGGRGDLRAFFQLMKQTCLRQQVAPNPARLELLESLWDEFSPKIYLGLAFSCEEAIAGVLMIGHGSRLTIWKKGWNAQYPRSYANCLLNVEALGWAADWGYTMVDFVGIDPLIATKLLSGAQLNEQQKHSRDLFHLRLGAEPSMLPPAQLLVLNPALRKLYSVCCRFPPFERCVMRRLASG